MLGLVVTNPTVSASLGTCRIIRGVRVPENDQLRFASGSARDLGSAKVR